MSDDLKLFDDEPALEVAPDDDLGVNAETMPTLPMTLAGDPTPVESEGRFLRGFAQALARDWAGEEPAVMGGGGGAGVATMLPTPPVPAPIAQLLPADFPLPALIRFVPDPAVKAALDEAVAYANGLTVKGAGVEGLQLADAALSTLNERLKATDAEFADAAATADQLHKSITGTRAKWKQAGDEMKRVLGRSMYDERARLEALAAEKRRKDQAEANRIERERAQQVADEARQHAAPAQVVEQLEQAAKTATAPPVPQSRPAAAAMASSTPVTKHKARILGTPADAEPNPTMENLTLAQWAVVAELMHQVAAGAAPRACFAIDWSYLNGRAHAEKSTLVIPGIEVFVEGNVRAKPTKRVR